VSGPSMVARAAWLFPGHGSQYVGMGRELLESWPAARATFERAEALSGLPLRRIMLRGSDEELRRPDVLEPALVALSLGHAGLASERFGPPRAVAGYSAGAVAALCRAGVLSEEDALQAAVLRGRILQRAAEAGGGGMSAVSGLSLSRVRRLVARVGGVELAGWNAPDQCTVTGRVEAIHLFERAALREGAGVSPVAAAGPWHGSLMREAAEEIAEALKPIRFSSPVLPVYTPVTGMREDDPAALRRGLAEQIMRPVLWRPLLRLLLRDTERLYEIGPGHTLIGFARATVGSSRRHGLFAVERAGGRLSRVAGVVAREDSSEKGEQVWRSV